MTRYDYAFKKQIVEAYQGSEGVYKPLTDRYSIPDSYPVKPDKDSLDARI